MRKEGKILPDDVMELKVQMTEELKTAEEKWADQHTKVEGTGDTEKFRCRFHFCNKVRTTTTTRSQLVIYSSPSLFRSSNKQGMVIN